MTAFDVRVLVAGEVTTSDLARWRELSESAVEPNLYLDPRYCAPMLALLHRSGVKVVVAEREGVWAAAVAVAPVNARLLGASHRVLTTGGPVIDHLYRTHPIVRSETAGADLAVLFRGLRSLRWGGILHLDDYFTDGPLAAAVGAAANTLNAPTLVDQRGYQGFALRGPATPVSDRDIFGPAHLSKSRRNKLRRHAQLLAERTNGALTYVNHGPDASALQEFIELQARGWKGDAIRGGKALALSDARVHALESALGASSADDFMFVGALRAGAQPVYMVVAMRSGNRVVCDVLDAYDETHRDLSAGTLGRLAHLAYVRQTWPDADFDPAIRSSAPEVATLYPNQLPTAGVHLAFGSAGARAVIRGAAVVRARRERGNAASASESGSPS